MKTKTLTSILLTCAVGSLLVPSAAQAGALIVSYEPIALLRNYNLTAQNGTDWVQYGNGGFPGVERKSGVAPANQIPDVIQIFSPADPGYWGDYGGTPNTYTWTDGDPTVSDTKGNGIYSGGLDGGWEFDLPASTTPKTIQIWGGCYESSALVEVWLSDGSATGFTNNTYQNLDGPNRLLSITYAADSAAQTCFVRITTKPNLDDPSKVENVTVQAVVLGPVEPVIAMNTVFDGQVHFDASLGLAFTASTPSPLTISSVSLTLNGLDVTSQLTLGGTASARTASLNNLRPNKYYAGSIVAVQSDGRTVTNLISFDTFTYGDSNSGLIIDAEDYNYNSGQFLNPTITRQYEGLAGVLGTDFNFTGSRSGDFYRGSGKMDAYGAVPWDQAHTPDWNFFIRGMLSGDYVNYTRYFKAGRYHVMARIAHQPNGPFASSLNLSKVADATVDGASQVLTDIGTVLLPNGFSDNFFFSIPLTNGLGQPLEVTLTEGVHSFRVTRADSDFANDEAIRLNWFGFSRVPAGPQLTITASGANVNLSFPTEAGATYTLQYKNALTDAVWQNLGSSIAGDGTVKTVSEASSQPTRFYRLEAN